MTDTPHDLAAEIDEAIEFINDVEAIGCDRFKQMERWPARIRALAPPEASPWRPIETAPRDGTRIIVGTKGSEVAFVRFVFIDWLRRLHGGVDKAWWVESGDVPPHWSGNAMTDDGKNPPIKWVPWPEEAKQ